MKNENNYRWWIESPMSALIAITCTGIFVLYPVWIHQVISWIINFFK